MNLITMNMPALIAGGLALAVAIPTFIAAAVVVWRNS
jgi:hypothetical protein